jgi:hypothetical protein
MDIVQAVMGRRHTYNARTLTQGLQAIAALEMAHELQYMGARWRLVAPYSHIVRRHRPELTRRH